MYKYNMYEFVDKINDYLREEGLYFKLIKYTNSDDFNLTASYKGIFFSSTTYDRADFEEQVYKMVNWVIKYKR